MANSDSNIPLLLECEEDGTQDMHEFNDDAEQEFLGNAQSTVETELSKKDNNNTSVLKLLESKNQLSVYAVRRQSVTPPNINSVNTINSTFQESASSDKLHNIEEDALHKLNLNEVSVNKAVVENVENNKLTTDPVTEVVDLTEDDENITSVTTCEVTNVSGSAHRSVSQKNNCFQNAVVTDKRTAPEVPIVDLTEDDEAPVTFNTVLNEKTGNSGYRSGISGTTDIRYKITPSLIVKQKPILKRGTVTNTSRKEDSNALASKVKGTLALNPMKLTEWLINEGLLNCEQFCKDHSVDGQPVKLKLGMYSDTSKFPFSGGYVWISDCCPSKFVSVFSGSIFERTLYQPDKLLKLIFHWCCQTDPHYIEKWVEIDKDHMEDFFQKIRSVCTAAIHDKFGKLGGAGRTVQVGMLNFNVMSRFKFKVLGALDVENKDIRLEVLDSTSNNVYNNVSRLLANWVCKDSVLVTNCLLIKGNLINNGFAKVSHSSFNFDCNNYNNINVIQYLSGIVPKVFQGIKPSFSSENIQLFLNEIVWRERWGYTPVKAFESLLSDIAGLTNSNTSLVDCLSKIHSFPFICWELSRWKNNCATIQRIMPRQRQSLTVGSTVRHSNIPQSECSMYRSPSDLAYSSQVESSGQSISLDTYYYGEILGDPEELEYSIAMECFMCNRYLSNNIDVMHHIIRFVSNGNKCVPVRNEMNLCHYCLMAFRTPLILNSHCEELHFKRDCRSLCRICSLKFSERTKLISHMYYSHNELELPYQCEVCGYRSSELYLTIDHFYNEHKESGNLQCPKCLKVFNCKMGDSRFALYQYLYHLKKHNFSSLTYRCSRCLLTFVDKDAHKKHWELHNSCKMIPFVKKYKRPNQGVIMPKPPRTQAPTIEYQEPSSVSFYIHPTLVEALNPLKLTDVSNVHCFECEGVINRHHYPGLLNCPDCKYKTNCSNAMFIHMAMIHQNQHKEHGGHVSKPIILERPMQCPCGVMFREGNRMAKHLVSCEKQTGYMLPGTPAILLSVGLIRKVLLEETESEEGSDCEASTRRSKRQKLM